MNNSEKIVGKIESQGLQVNVVEVKGMTGYRFDAFGKESLPLAVDLALKQTRGELHIKENQPMIFELS